MLHLKYFILFLILPFACPQTASDYYQNINNLYEEFRTYKSPTSYRDFYNEDALYLGLYGIFDFIVVGSGAAGSLLARRLSENPNWKILLLEAGPSDSYITDVPGLNDLLEFSTYNYGYRSTPQVNSFYGLVNNSCYIRRGRVLGGSSTINLNTYVRGNAICDILNNQGLNLWNSSICLEYFKRSENASTPVQPSTTTTYSLNSDEDSHEGIVSYYQLEPGYHNTSGPLHTEAVKHFDVLGNSLMSAAIELNRNILDYNGKSQMGYSMIQSNTNGGKKVSGSRAFLNDILNRTNLVILTNAFVTKLTYTLLTNQVNGINFVLGNYAYTALATKEVILSAESVRSPQILMRSGIGPAAELNALNIPVVKDLPVGQNLISYPLVVLPVQLNNPIVLPDMTTLIQDYLDGYGLLTTSKNFQAFGSINTVNASATYPNSRHWFAMPYFGQDYGYNVNYLQFTNETFNAYFGTVTPNQKVVGFNVIFIEPKSRGRITLKSCNSFDYPNIDLNYFDNSADIDGLVAAIKDAYTILGTNAMKQYGISVPNNPLPGCSQYVYNSDDYLRCMVQQVAVSSSYLAGTVKMGLANDATAVVDQTFKVIGVRNLRVVDDSVISYPATSYSNAMETMYAERAADMIKSDHNTDYL